MNTNLQQQITVLFENWAKETVQSIQLLPQSGSDRQYFRVKGIEKTALAAFNTVKKENKTFVDYTEHFLKKGINVPELYGQNLDQNIYLLQDLGDLTLLQYLEAESKDGLASDSTVRYYKKALAALAFMQVEGIQGLNVAAYHTPVSFNEQAMLWDLNYFKYCFLKTTKVEFDEAALEKDFQIVTKYLGQESPSFFMFRDFQARNIMLHAGEVYFIDYQGGKKGPLQYDVVSLLFQAKANLSNALRQELLEYYIQEVAALTLIDQKKFKDSFYLFVLIRTLQVLGAYGYKGLYEQKEHFIASIPFALKNLSWLLKEVDFPIDLSYLKQVLLRVIEKEATKKLAPIQKAKQLTVQVKSFSYKRGIPKDNSGNGGGFVFDCRFIHNPGRYQPYKKLTGRDQEVIEFFEKESSIHHFVEQVKVIVEEAVENYIERGFANLCINFGCTGGQHRSVFSADCIAQHLQEKYAIKVILHHREQERKNWIN
ncbi:MAG: COG3178: Predicted phosphotransferase related to Ser/Thr protein kinases [uncultured Aureispira sp.]|uniref:COG3178: Predicted phosphotransferase related to Ser/Thr protein kinases n=1 Tax=uncultured Aureispira sp. TaxID=1331704 RepID=A0A6S6U7Q5_9BACT|nr:MAG: COG3178: Predicted phosphotransferase related to Ser/Thr protein kinases [uncultured Aureispira sp.]